MASILSRPQLFNVLSDRQCLLRGPWSVATRWSEWRWRRLSEHPDHTAGPWCGYWEAGNGRWRSAAPSIRGCNSSWWTSCPVKWMNISVYLSPWENILQLHNLESPATLLFILQLVHIITKETSQFRITAPLGGESTLHKEPVMRVYMSRCHNY